MDASDYHSIQMLWRYLEVSRYYSNMDGLLRAQFAYPNVEFRNVVAPSAEMPSSWYPLNLSEAEVEQIYDLGVTDGTTAANDSEATQNLNDFFALKKKSDKRLRGGVTYEKFLEMKQNGDFAEFNAFKDSMIQALFLQ